MEKVGLKKSFERLQKVAVLVLCVMLAGSFFSCGKRAEAGGDCPPCKHDDASSDISHYSYIGEDKRYYEVSDNKIMFQYFYGSKDSAKIMNSLQEICTRIRKVTKLSHFDEFMLVELDNISKEQVICLIELWNVSENNTYASPILSEKEGVEFCFVPNQLFVRIKSETDYPLLLKVLKSYNVKSIESKEELLPLLYLVTINDAHRKNSMQIANELHESGLFYSVAPEMVIFVKRYTNDTHYG